jgi:hypothetical protein
MLFCFFFPAAKRGKKGSLPTQRFGTGTYKNADGTWKYTGEWVADKRQGTGEPFLPVSGLAADGEHRDQAN